MINFDKFIEEARSASNMLLDLAVKYDRQLYLLEQYSESCFICSPYWFIRTMGSAGVYTLKCKLTFLASRQRKLQRLIEGVLEGTSSDQNDDRLKTVAKLLTAAKKVISGRSDDLLDKVSVSEAYKQRIGFFGQSKSKKLQDKVKSIQLNYSKIGKSK